MNEYTLFLISLIFLTPAVSWSAGNVVFGYDKSNSQIYAKIGNEKATLNFKEDYTGNPAYAFDLFHGLPAIIADSRSLHDSTTYAVLGYRKEKFSIDCLYYEVKSKKNGVFIKEGVCDLNENNVGDYQNIINEKINGVENYMDAVDTSLLLTDKTTYLSIVIYNSKEQTLRKIYTNKQSLLDDEYLIASMNNSGLCDVYENNPWVVYSNNAKSRVQVLKDSGEKERLILATPSVNSEGACSSYPAVNVKVPKAFLYNSNKNVEKSYLVKGDALNIRSVSDDGEWCQIKYINDKNKSIDSTVQCQDLAIFK